MKEKERKEWLKKIRLAKYTSLKLKKDKSKDEIELMRAIETTLFDMGISSIEIDNYFNSFIQDDLEEKISIKCNDFFDEILSKIEHSKDEEIDTKKFPEFYFKIQEVLAMDSDMAQVLLKEAEKRVNVEHILMHNSDMEGNDLGNHVYYFSKK